MAGTAGSLDCHSINYRGNESRQIGSVHILWKITFRLRALKTFAKPTLARCAVRDQFFADWVGFIPA